MVLNMQDPSAGDVRRFAEEDRILSQIATTVEADTANNSGRIIKTDVSSEVLRDLIVDILNDAKAEELVTIDLQGKTAMADYMIVCSGRSSRQVAGMADRVSEGLKAELDRFCKMEGKTQGDWVLIDTGDVVVHVFRPEVRDFYQLEKMWMSPPEQA
ncbi:MAG: ribosome-associated protein [Dinoroseobacter sp.]|jgi:ribosome-associated protein